MGKAMTREILCLTFFLLLTAPVLAIELYRAKKMVVVYENPSENSPIIYRFQPGEEFRVIGKEKGRWLKVRFSNQVLGYVQEAEAVPVFSGAGDSERRSRLTAKPRSKQLRIRLPYSYEESSLRITVLKVVPATRQHGSSLPDSQQWTVRIRYENLTNRDWKAPDLGSGIGHLVGFRSLKLVTDQGNIYNLRYSGGISISGSLRPRGSVTSGEAPIFDIRQNERPFELWAYRLRAGGKYPGPNDPPDFIFELDNIR
jgi:hypothetical protein